MRRLAPSGSSPPHERGAASDRRVDGAALLNPCVARGGPSAEGHRTARARLPAPGHWRSARLGRANHTHGKAPCRRHRRSSPLYPSASQTQTPPLAWSMAFRRSAWACNSSLLARTTESGGRFSFSRHAKAPCRRHRRSSPLYPSASQTQTPPLAWSMAFRRSAWACNSSLLARTTESGGRFSFSRRTLWRCSPPCLD